MTTDTSTRTVWTLNHSNYNLDGFFVGNVRSFIYTKQTSGECSKKTILFYSDAGGYYFVAIATNSFYVTLK